MNHKDEKIIKYLVNKQLPIDLIAEVHDHMMSQINNLLIEGFTFEEAFDSVKLEWEADLQIDSNVLFSTGKSIFARRIYWMRIKAIFQKSIVWGVLTFLGFGLIATIVNLKIFETTIYLSSALVLITTIYKLYFQTKKNRELIKKYDNYKLTLFDSLPFATNFTIVSIGQLCFWADESYLLFTDLLSFQWELRHLLLSLLLILWFIIISMNFYMISKLNHSYQRIQPYLSYLKPNRFYT